LKDFAVNPSIGLAADAINSAFLSDRKDAAIAPATFILKSDHIPTTLRKLAQKIVGEAQETESEPDLSERSSQNIRRLRHLLKIDPRSSVLLVDLAREYAGVGKLNAADRSMQTALAYGGNDRWVSRMAARFYVHWGKKDKAHHLIANHPLARSDPWMLAAEIAIAQANGKAPVHWKRAKNLLEGTLPPVHLSELACAVATLEMDSGTNRKARKYFTQALLKPTENALAQLKWAERNLKANFETDQHLGQSHNAFEANFWASYYRADLVNARQFAGRWLAQEPFSKRPATMLSFLFGLLDDHEHGLEAANWGLRANPEDVTLRLNKYFAEISRGWDGIPTDEVLNEQDRIEKELRSLIHNRVESQHAAANLGLLYYRQGKHAEGRTLYDLAISTLNNNHNELSAAAAKVFHAREAVLHRCEWAAEVVSDAKFSIEKAVSPGLKFYLAKIETAIKHPEQADRIFLKTSEENNAFVPPPEVDATNHMKKIDFEITRSGATIWLPTKPYKGS
jgi:tetratricopeptide (TPR) repeat protein